MAARFSKARVSGRHGRGDTLVSGTGDFSLLDCGCLRHGAVGTELYCPRHRRVSVITQAASEWIVACLDCRRTKRHGLARITAEVDARRHSRRCQHRVQVFHGATFVEEIGPRAPGQMSLFNKDGTQDG